MNDELADARRALLLELQNAESDPCSEFPIWLTIDHGKLLYMASDDPEFINCATVVVSLLPVQEGLAVIRRGKVTDDGYGKLGLIGGFQDGKISEPVRKTACREMSEEIGLDILPQYLKLINIETDEYGHNVVFFEVVLPEKLTWSRLQELSTIDKTEVLELVLLTKVPPIEDVAFPFHYAEIVEYFKR